MVTFLVVGDATLGASPGVLLFAAAVTAADAGHVVSVARVIAATAAG